MKNEDQVMKSLTALSAAFERIDHTSDPADIRIELYACERLVQDIRAAMIDFKNVKKLNVEYFFDPHLKDLYSVYNGHVYFNDPESMNHWEDVSHLWDTSEILNKEDDFVPISSDDPRIIVKMLVE